MPDDATSTTTSTTGSTGSEGEDKPAETTGDQETEAEAEADDGHDSDSSEEPLTCPDSENLGRGCA